MCERPDTRDRTPLQGGEARRRPNETRLSAHLILSTAAPIDGIRRTGSAKDVFSYHGVCFCKDNLTRSITYVSVPLPQIMSLDELEIRDLDQVTRVYAALLSAHVRLLKVLLPRTHWKEVPVVVVFEQNTYVNALADVKELLEYSLVRSGFKVLFYSRWSQVNGRYMLGKHVSAKTKLAMVLSAAAAIERDTLGYCECVMSLGWAVLAEASAKGRALEAALGTRRGAGSSTRTGSTMAVHMYRRSRNGIDLATDVTARVMETRDVIHLPESRLADRLHAQQGKQLLSKLRDEMASVVITDTGRGCGIVATGGKRSVGGEYTRDDMLSAFLLLSHTRDEIHSGDRSVRICGEVHCL